MSCCTSCGAAIRRGDCYDLEVVYKADDVVVDLSGWNAEFAVSWIRAQPTSRSAPPPSQTLTVSTLTSGIDPLGNDGRIVVHLTAAQTEQIRPSQSSGARTQLRLIQPDGCTKTILSQNLDVYSDNFGGN